MAAPTRPKRSDSSYSDGNADMVRGSILIGIAVIIAAVLLWQGFGADDTDDGETSAGDTTGETVLTDPTVSSVLNPASDPTATVGLPSSTTQAPGRPNAEITVMVANGITGVSGVAGGCTSKLGAEGFQTVDPDNADRRDYQTSSVYYAGDDSAEAAKVATALGIDAATVAAMPNPPPLEDGSLNGASVLAVIGADLAQFCAGG